MSTHTQPPDPDTVRHFQDNDDESIEHEDERDTPEPSDKQCQKIDKQLDDALAATFPASDPVSIAGDRRLITQDAVSSSDAPL
jgi:hypothetical protein